MAYIDLLIAKRADLPDIPASIEKRLMLNRLIYAVQQVETQPDLRQSCVCFYSQNTAAFDKRMADILLDMHCRITDHSAGQQVPYSLVITAHPEHIRMHCLNSKSSKISNDEKRRKNVDVCSISITMKCIKHPTWSTYRIGRSQRLSSMLTSVVWTNNASVLPFLEQLNNSIA